MKTVYNGVLYDSDTAEHIGDFVASSDAGPNSCYGALYKTPRSGRYFVHGNGGFLTRFKGEDRIIPVTEGEARLLKNTLIKRSQERKK